MSRWLVLPLVLGAALSCGTSFDSGSYGTFRFFGRVKGTTPLDLLPPISDRNGDLYTMYGAIGLPEVTVYASAYAGGSYSTCSLTKGDAFGAHGWVGFNDENAYYWSGDALVFVGTGCHLILNVDPQTNADLQFKSVMPYVLSTSTRSSAVALVRSPTDLQPFSALIDLDRAIMTNVSPLPGTGTVTVLGAGAERDGDARVTLINRDGKMEADFFDEQAYFAGSAPVSGNVPPEYGVLGYLRRNPAGTWAGLTSLGTLLVFNRSGGGEMAFDASVKPVGVHLWKDALWLVGTSGTRPVVIPLDDAGRPGQTFEWSSSETAAANISGALTVNDDRSYPVHTVTWTNVVSAIGAKPFLSPFSPWPNATDSTLWVVAGPTSTEGQRPLTSVAVAPVGITYP